MPYRIGQEGVGMRGTAGSIGNRGCVLGRIAATMAAAITAAVAGPLVAPGPAMADRVRSDQWYLDHLHATAAWRYAKGAGVTVAVIDSGVDATHPDLLGQVLAGTDLVRMPATDGRTDPVGHGTTVAAMIAGRGDDSVGVRGLAPLAKILPVRVLDDDNKYDDASTVARGLRWAVDHGATVANLSLGGAVRSGALAEAIAYATAHDVVVVACTGNRSGGGAGTGPGTGPGGGSGDIWDPARESGVIAVAGLTNGAPAGQPAPPAGQARRGATAAAPRDSLWDGSITGPRTVLAAPAVNLTGARPGGYWRVQGTSFAAPLVAATAALVRSRWPGMSAANVINRLIRSARDLGAPGRDDQYGFGEIDPAAALTAAVPQVAENPLAAPAPAVEQASISTAVPTTTDTRPKPVAAPSRLADAAAGTTLTGTTLVAVLWVGLMVLWLRHRRSSVPPAVMTPSGWAEDPMDDPGWDVLDTIETRSVPIGAVPPPRVGGQAQRWVLTASVRPVAAATTGDASAAVSANPVSASSAAAAKMTPSTAPSADSSGPPELPLRTSARIV
jgi:type VII secretion-associated serine protease mycosin